MCFCTATAFGKGVYFANIFTYSAQPAYSPPDKNNNKYVFQCRVLTGRFHKGNPALLEPPVMDKKSLSLYDSVVDNLKNPVIFVVFHDNQAYPEYLITFLAWLSTFLSVVFHRYLQSQQKGAFVIFRIKNSQITPDYGHIVAYNVSIHSPIKCAYISMYIWSLWCAVKMMFNRDDAVLSKKSPSSFSG